MQCHGLQCGFCTPGMMMTARALLDRNPDPTEDEIREAISGQICRCTGYTTIVRSVQWAARHGRGGGRRGADRKRRSVPKPATICSRRGARHDDRRSQARGYRRQRPEALSATAGCCARRTRASSAAAATTSTTSSCPACCTWRSCARRSRTPGSSASTSLRRRHIRRSRPSSPAPTLAEKGLAWMPTLSNDVQAVLATDKVRFQGQEVAFVVAEDRYSARDALELIDVDYEPLEPVIDVRKALDPDAAGDPRPTSRARPTTTASTGRPATRRPPRRSSRRPTSSSPRTSSTRACTRRRWRPAVRWPISTR